MKENPTSSLSDAEWQLWYHDTFDHDASPTLEREGMGFLNGLIMLWSKYLSERVGLDGQFGFSDFSLRCNDQNIFIRDENSKFNFCSKEAMRLRHWIFAAAERFGRL
jgi:hypothetical protein